MENRGGGPRRSTRIVTRKPLTLEPSKDDNTADDDEPLNRLGPETPAEIGSPSLSSSSSGTKYLTSGEISKDEESGERPEGILGVVPVVVVVVIIDVGVGVVVDVVVVDKHRLSRPALKLGRYHERFRRIGRQRFRQWW